MAKPTKETPLKYDRGAKPVIGAQGCCVSALRLYYAQGGSQKEGARETCLYCGTAWLAGKSAWEKAQ